MSSRRADKELTITLHLDPFWFEPKITTLIKHHHIRTLKTVYTHRFLGLSLLIFCFIEMTIDFSYKMFTLARLVSQSGNEISI